jgi:toxin ParE1/3/4
MPRVTIRPAAKRDLVRIGRYTEARWGRPQRDRYLTMLDGRIADLADTPPIGRRRDEIREGLRSIHAGRHVVFYRVGPDTIEIVRVLHERMDAGPRLGGRE